ncbi:MAG: lysophospholipid acyltransferase family protein, partial [Solimonas sp.]
MTIGLPRTRGMAWAASLFDAATGLRTLETYYRARPAALPPPDFVRYSLDTLGIGWRLSAGSPDDIPQSGPLLVTANHPYGVAEGLALADLFLRRRSDVRLLANTLLQGITEFAPLVLPVDVFKSGVNGASIRAALHHLK